MLNRIKRFILIMFLVFLVTDCCTYTRILNLTDNSVSSFNVFYTTLTNGSFILNTSIIYLVIVSLVVFVKYFFSEAEGK